MHFIWICNFHHRNWLPLQCGSLQYHLITEFSSVLFWTSLFAIHYFATLLQQYCILWVNLKNNAWMHKQYSYSRSNSNTLKIRLYWISQNGPLTRYVKITGCACVGYAGNVFPAADFKGSRCLAISACIMAHMSRMLGLKLGTAWHKQNPCDCNNSGIECQSMPQFCFSISLTLRQWSSSGNPVCLELRPQCTLECHWRIIFGSQCASSCLPVVFQWLSNGLPVCSNYAN